jgi:hypothetical protein
MRPARSFFSAELVDATSSVGHLPRWRAVTETTHHTPQLPSELGTHLASRVYEVGKA